MFLLPSFTTYARRQRDPREREVSAPLLNLPLVGRSDGAGGGVGVGAHATALRGIPLTAREMARVLSPRGEREMRHCTSSNLPLGGRSARCLRYRSAA
jgi:hypothetical protein